MIPANCLVPHKPDEGKYGDCLRACIATMLSLDSEDVPHFYHDGCDGDTGHARMVEYLASQGLVVVVLSGGESGTRDEIVTQFGTANPNAPYMLFGGMPGGGDHVVVCKGGAVFHDPAWIKVMMSGPTSQGVWLIMVLVRAA